MPINGNEQKQDGARERALWVRVFASILNNLSKTPGIHLVDVENQLPQIVF